MFKRSEILIHQKMESTLIISGLILIGIVTFILAIALIQKNRYRNQKPAAIETDSKAMGTGIGIGLVIGMALGVGIGLAMDSLPIGIAIGAGSGVSIGVAIGTTLKRKKQNTGNYSSFESRNPRLALAVGILIAITAAGLLALIIFNK